jgi:hypothetical protein
MSDLGALGAYAARSDLVGSWYSSAMMKRATLAIADIYVPVKRRATLDQKRVDEIAASILDKGLQAPILVRADGAVSCWWRAYTVWKLPRRSVGCGTD